MRLLLRRRRTQLHTHRAEYDTDCTSCCRRGICGISGHCPAPTAFPSANTQLVRPPRPVWFGATQKRRGKTHRLNDIYILTRMDVWVESGERTLWMVPVWHTGHSLCVLEETRQRMPLVGLGAEVKTQRGVEGRVEETESERELGRRLSCLLGAVRFGKPRTREHNRRAQKRKEGGLWTAY
jgi:hypothetical protein